MVHSKHTWAEKSLYFLRTTLGNFQRLSKEDALKRFLGEAAEILQASDALFLVYRPNGDFEVNHSRGSNLNGQMLSSDFFMEQLELNSINFSKSPSEVAKIAAIKPSSGFLTIPLKDTRIKALLVFGLSSPRKMTIGLNGFAEMLQTLWLELMGNNGLLPQSIISSENQLKSHQAILENIPDLIFSLDKNSRFTTLNPSFQKILSLETRKKFEVGDLFPEDVFTKLFSRQITHLLEMTFQGKQHSEEILLRLNDKEIFYEFSFYPIRTDAKQVTEIGVFGHDIGKRKKSEFQVRQKSQMLNSILQNLPVIIFRISPSGDFLELSGAGLKKLQIKDNQMAGKKALEVFPELKQAMKKMKKGEHQQFTIEGTNKGNTHVFETYTFSDETNPGGLVGFAIDVTEQNRIKQQLQQAKEVAESANLAKSNFLANQSHEIRTPINAMLGFAQLLKNRNHPAESEEYLDFIISSGKILLSLLGNVLDLTKIEEGKLELEEEAFNFKETINSNIHPYKFQAQEKGLKFSVNFDTKIPEYLFGDPNKIIQLLINLISNSLKFTKKGEIKVDFTHVSTFENGQSIILRMAVSDTGIGIPKKKQSSIFENFTQADKTINKKFGGFGLGLSIVKELTNLMGGELGVESPGEMLGKSGPTGSTFWINLPLQVTKAPHRESLEEIESTSIDYSGEVKVLLVDDNYLNQRLGSAMLKDLGCTVIVANNGKEALQEVEKEEIDLIFMDVQMPVLDGFETTRRIRDGLHLNIPIIGLSANVYKEDINLCFESGMDDYLGRPFTKKSFQEKVIKWSPIMERPSDHSKLDLTRKLTALTFLQQVFNGDNEIIIEIVEDFIHHQDIMVSQLGEALLEKDFKKIATLSHKIRSSLQTVGLNSLYKTLTDMEHIAKDSKDEKNLKRHYDEVKATCQQAKGELMDSLAELKNN